MASILKRGDSYSVRYKYKDHSGKPCEGWESFKTKKEAQERKITVEKELLDSTFLVPDTMTVEEMLYKWIPIQSTKHKWSPKTYTQSVAMVQNLIVPYIGKRKVQELRTYDIEFYATLAKTPCGQYVHGVKQALTVAEQNLLLSYLSKTPKYQHWYPIFAVMLGTGLRVGEATGLRWCDVDLEEGTISVNHTLVNYDHRENNGGRKGCYFNCHSPKTKGRCPHCSDDGLRERSL